MCTRPWCTTRFSPRFLKVLRGAFFPPSAFFSGVAPAAASAFAIRYPLNGLLLGDRALAWSLPRPRVGARALPARRQVAPMTEAPVAADLHQSLDVHRDLLAE